MEQYISTATELLKCAQGAPWASQFGVTEDPDAAQAFSEEDLAAAAEAAATDERLQGYDAGPGSQPAADPRDQDPYEEIVELLRGAQGSAADTGAGALQAASDMSGEEMAGAGAVMGGGALGGAGLVALLRRLRGR